ncbi:NEL-type E3 ubiquitin ligase domain-containing protein [Pseudomonas sp. NPDC089395]|uniref:NEL-type E3 ubiquitin ligase domain-containing protein n=1 Tax=Pseudomonas sp. NPDC089395 TaxID=3364460 RepID=UPI00381F2DB4
MLLERGTDLIEIRLALRQDLAALLDFPEPSQDMLYRAEAMISAQVASNVERAVVVLDQTAAERRGWVARQPTWQRYLIQRFARRFGTVDERWYQGMQYLDYCLDPDNEAVTSLAQVVLQAITEVLPTAPLDEGGQLRRMALQDHAYDQASRRLNAGRDQERQALFEQLTREQDMND